MKIRLVGAELFHAGGWADRDMTEIIVGVRSFANEPKNEFHCTLPIRFLG